MSKALLCETSPSGAAERCFTMALDAADRAWWSISFDKIAPVLISVFLSAGVTFLVLKLSRRRDDAQRELERRRELRKVSMDLYREFFSEELAGHRYDAERFFEIYPDVDWSVTDPYGLSDPEETRAGYAAVTRFWARVAILYDEDELDRDFTQKLMSRMAGYWWGLTYSAMTRRSTMFTGPSIAKLFRALKKSSGGDEFREGRSRGEARREGSKDELKHRLARLPAGRVRTVPKGMVATPTARPAST